MNPVTRSVLVILAGDKFELDEEAARFDENLPAAIAATRDAAIDDLARGGFVAPAWDRPLLMEFTTDRQVWVCPGDSLAAAVKKAGDQARRLVSSLDGWPKQRVRLTFLRGQHRQLPETLLLALRCTPGVELACEDPAGARNVFGPVAMSRRAA